MSSLSDAVQGARHTPQTITWEGQNLTGATLTATKRNVDTGAVTAVDGVLTVTDAANGIFTWTYGAGDVGTAGHYALQFRATYALFDATVELSWVVHPLQSATTTPALPLVGVAPDDAAWAAAGRATVPDGSNIASTTDVSRARAAANAASGQPRPSARGTLITPTPRTLAGTVSATNADHRILWLSADRSRVYAGYFGSLRYSDDDGATWTALQSFAGQVYGVRDMDNGELLVSISLGNTPPDQGGELWLSDNYDNGAGTPTWSMVLETSTYKAFFTGDWGMSVYENIAVVAEYGLKGSPDHARKVYASEDYGVTWAEIYELVTTSDNAHTHGCAYDPYYDRMWITTGDAGTTYIRFSDDWRNTTPTWTALEGDGTNDLMVGILPLENCVLFSSDTEPAGLYRWWRRGLSDTSRIENFYAVTSAATLQNVGGMMFRAGEGYPVYHGIKGVQNTLPGIILATQDGVDAYEIWRDPTTGAYLSQVVTVVGPTVSGKLLAQLVRNSVFYIVTLDAPDFVTRRRIVPEWSSQKYAYFDGASGTSVEMDTVLDPSSTLDIRAYIRPTKWADGTNYQTIAAKWQETNGLKSWSLSLRPLENKLFFRYSADGTALTGQVSSSAIPITDGDACWVRVQHVTVEGVGRNTYFFYSLDGATWTAINNQYYAGNLPLPATVGPITFGGNYGAGTTYRFIGKIYEVQIYEDDVLIANPDFTTEDWQDALIDTVGAYDQFGYGYILKVGASIRNDLAISNRGGDVRIPTITGSAGANAALISLLFELERAGLITDSTT